MILEIFATAEICSDENSFFSREGSANEKTVPVTPLLLLKDKGKGPFLSVFVFKPQPPRRAAVNSTGRLRAVLIQFGYRLNQPPKTLKRDNILPRHGVCVRVCHRNSPLSFCGKGIQKEARSGECPNYAACASKQGNSDGLACYVAVPLSGKHVTLVGRPI